MHGKSQKDIHEFAGSGFSEQHIPDGDIHGTDAVIKAFPASLHFYKAVASSPVIQHCVANSALLRGLCQVRGEEILNAERRISKAIGSIAQEKAEYNATLGKAVGMLNGYADRLDTYATAAQESGIVVKSLNDGSLAADRQGMSYPQNQQIMQMLYKGVHDGQLDGNDVVAFESTGNLTPRAAALLGVNR